MAMRKSLAWTLAATLALSAVALWQPQAPEPIQAVVREAAGHVQQVQALDALRAPGTVVAAAPGLPTGPLPAQWPVAELEPARRDPFQAVPAAPAAPAAPPPPPVQPMPQLAAPPEPPPMSYRFVGRFTAPDGQARIFLGKGDGSTVEAGVGTTLESGYVVESVKAAGVTLVYPALGSRFLLPLPPQ